MKLIEAMKQTKELARKRDDLLVKIKQYCADLSYETPLYPDTRKQISEWLQASNDLNKEILRLRIGVQKTNLVTMVTIKIGDKDVIKSIAEWIHRRRDLAKSDETIWASLTDRNLRESTVPNSAPGGAVMEVKIRRYFDPLERDKKIELFRSEPSTIDGTLETINAVTDMIE